VTASLAKTGGLFVRGAILAHKKGGYLSARIARLVEDYFMPLLLAAFLLRARLFGFLRRLLGGFLRGFLSHGTFSLTRVNDTFPVTHLGIYRNIT